MAQYMGTASSIIPDASLNQFRKDNMAFLRKLGQLPRSDEPLDLTAHDDEEDDDG